MMKRITKLLASILFIVTVLTAYLTFDFAISSALSNKNPSNKHEHLHHDTKHKRTSSSLINNKTPSRTLKPNNINDINHIVNQDRHIRSIQDKRKVVKHAPFHKSKTGIKINQIKKPKQQHKNSLTTKLIQHKFTKPKHTNIHV